MLGRLLKTGNYKTFADNNKDKLLLTGVRGLRLNLCIHKTYDSTDKP